jgi:hypothetical protein
MSLSFGGNIQIRCRTGHWISQAALRRSAETNWRATAAKTATESLDCRKKSLKTNYKERVGTRVARRRNW